MPEGLGRCQSNAAFWNSAGRGVDTLFLRTRMSHPDGTRGGMGYDRANDRESN